MLYRCVVITINSTALSFNGSREEIDIWLLDLIEKEQVKFYKIINRETKEVIETEKGKK